MNTYKFQKYIEFIQTKFIIMIKEKHFFSNGYNIRYLFEQNDSDTLVVIFSGFTRNGIKARYNYNRTLRNLKINKLFILDNFGYDERGAYYLGHDMDFKIQNAVMELIQKTQQTRNIKKSIYTGTSKGGYAALYFGLQEKDSIIIAGAPQYYLGLYLNGTENYRKNCLPYIVGNEITNEKIDLLNNLLPNKFKQCSNNNNSIYLHYSSMENTYRKQIKYLINDLNDNNYKLFENVEKYENHNDVSLFFPKYLIETINEVI